MNWQFLEVLFADAAKPAEFGIIPKSTIDIIFKLLMSLLRPDFLELLKVNASMMEENW